MDREELISSMKLIYNLCDNSWEDNDIICFSDDKVDIKFRRWLKSNDLLTYEEINNNLKNLDRNNLNFSIFDFFEIIDDKTDEELIEIFIDFLIDNEELKEELEFNIEQFLEINQEDEYDEDYYDENYEELKEDRYDDYDYYDEYN